MNERLKPKNLSDKRKEGSDTSTSCLLRAIHEASLPPHQQTSMEKGVQTRLETGAAEEKEPHGKTPSAGSADPGHECYKRNGLINTHNLMVETKEGLVSVYSAPQYQGHVVSKDINGTPDGRGHPQLLNPSALPQAIDPYYRPNLLLYPESVLRAWGEGGDCCETTFIEEMNAASSGSAVTKDGILFTDNKLLDLSMEDAKIQTLSYDVDDDDDEFQELEVRDCSLLHF
ncbi:hypothetical protein H4Q32_008903 [Labeo rohita]|uniref:Synapse differentiation-inducing gene protein 1 n=1 Tax=Labeo rohita TaxID=84645 RepID=A0ABQ8M6T6_LABRO|nr:hypothetical protein H4Q32_008903 [Labeo rohita]